MKALKFNDFGAFSVSRSTPAELLSAYFLLSKSAVNRWGMPKLHTLFAAAGMLLFLNPVLQPRTITVARDKIRFS